MLYGVCVCVCVCVRACTHLSHLIKSLALAYCVYGYERDFLTLTHFVSTQFVSVQFAVTEYMNTALTIWYAVVA